MEIQNCDQCENQCAVDDLKCGKGRKRFGLAPEGGPDQGRGGADGPVGLLRQCGHILHHGGVSGEDLLSALTEQDQAELTRLLGALLADWKSRAPADSQAHRHG